MHPTLLVLMGRPEEGDTIGQESLRQLPPGRSFPYSMLSNSLAYLAMTLGHHQEARQPLKESRRTQDASGGKARATGNGFAERRGNRSALP